MKVMCPTCQLQIQSGDMNLMNMVAKCWRCHAIIDLRELIGPGESSEGFVRELPEHKKRPAVQIPLGFRIDDSGSDLKISWSWFKWSLILLLCFCIAWDSFLVFWYTKGVQVNGPWLMFVFPIAHVAVGIVLTYTTLAGFLNRTTVSVRGELLSVCHGPLPWSGNHTLETGTLEQLYTSEKSHPSKSGISFTYDVCATTRDGHKLILVSGLSEVDQALFLEQRIESYLGIEDQQVPGEVTR